jgi:ABC-2 type transport system permease protein
MKERQKKEIKIFGLSSFLNDLGSDIVYPVWPLFVRLLGAPMSVLGFLDGLGEALVSISFGFIGLGLIFASVMRDIQGFGLIMQIIVFPLFFLSGAIFPLSNLPKFLRYISYINPLTYGVEGLRRSSIGFSFLLFWFNLLVLVIFSVFTIFLGSYLFEKSEI